MDRIKWTPSQREAIESGGGNVLVSAAAGSGKTAVLVERVLRRVLDPENPVEIDSFVIITFTKAAASQMRDKIKKGLKEALSADPGNDFIKRQILKLHTARICTIDALCLDIVRENFHAVDVDPAFRTAASEETDIIKKDILSQVLEENYASKKRDGSREAFFEFVESYIGRDDRKVEALIEKIFKFAQSDAEPFLWMEKSIAVYKSAGSLGSSGESVALWDYFKGYMSSALSGIKALADRGLVLSLSENGPLKYRDIFRNYSDTCARLIKELKAGEIMFSRMKEELELMVPSRAPVYTAKSMEKEGVDPGLKEEAKLILDECKKAVKEDLLSKFFFQDMEAHYKDLAGCAYVAQTLINITKEFSRRFEEEKRKRAIADFSDISHNALKVLIEHDGNGNMVRDRQGRPVYTETADSMARGITEIIVDEYQDTNMLQEYIINALSAERFGRPDVFMVGDMKQSIYRFRFAVPELFTGKYDSFAEGKTNRRVILGNNFRSRPEILDFANYIFGRIMTKETGEIDYSDQNALVRSPSYEENPPSGRIVPEVYIIEGKSAEGKKCEAYLAAGKIEEMAGRGEIEDGGVMRKIRYSDIAVLTPKNESPEIEQELEARKIPFIRASNRGFFDSFEVSLLINLLEIIDNPYQDIPFAAVLRSPLAGFTANDLAVLKADNEGTHFSVYQAVCSYLERSGRAEGVPAGSKEGFSGPDAFGGTCGIPDEEDSGSLVPESSLPLKISLRHEAEENLECFMEKLEKCRIFSLSAGASELIGCVTEMFGFYDIFAAMSGGEIRKANLDRFCSMAVSYEENGHPGLFDFLRYLGKTRKNGYDCGNSSLASEGADAVSIMTIHKSKGLEFPIVFLINTGNTYVEEDARGDIILDKDLGLGVDLRNTKTRVRTPVIAKNIIAAKIKNESRAEQMRVLYVALTRAKTKLIITGTARKTDMLKKDSFPDEAGLSGRSVMACTSHLSLIMLALSNGYKDVCSLEILRTDEVMGERILKAARDGALKEKLYKMAEESAGQAFEIEEKLKFSYPFGAAAGMPVKITPSGLEKNGSVMRGRTDPDEKTSRNNITEDGGVAGPSFTGAGAARGTAYHRFFEILDYDNITSGGAFLLEGAVKSGLMKKEEAAFIEPEKADRFLSSPLARRMAHASGNGKLRREQPFVMGVETEGGVQLVQGIIDAFFEEEDGIVLVDYKTDKNKRPADFIRIYKAQINVYADAIERALSKKVKEKLIYSVELGKVIKLD